MATPVLCCGLECGVFGSTAHLDIAVGTPTVVTSPVNNGLRALRCNAAAAQVAVVATVSASNQLRHVGRCYIRFAVLPDADCCLINTSNSLDVGPQLRFKFSDSKLYAAVDTKFGAT